MYVLYPFSSKTFWAGVDDTKKPRQTEVTPIYKKSFWKEGKAYTVEIILPGNEGETVLVEIPKNRQYEESRIESQRQEYSACQQLEQLGWIHRG